MYNNNFQPPVTIQEKKDIRKNYNKGAGVLLLFFVISNIVARSFSYFYGHVLLDKGLSLDEVNEIFSSMSLELLILNIVMGIISYPIAIKFGGNIQNIKIKSFFNPTVISGKFLLKAIAVTIGAQAIGSYLSMIVAGIAKLFDVELITLDMSLNTSPEYNIILFLLSCISAPIFEELLFRGVVLRAFSRVNVNFGIIMSAFLFAIFHGNIPQAINAFFVGIVLAYVAVKTGSVILCIILHFCANLNGMIQQIILSKNYLAAIIYSNVFMIAFLTAAIIILITDRKNFSIIKTNQPLENGRLKIFLSSWTFWLVLIGYGYTIIKSIKIG